MVIHTKKFTIGLIFVLLMLMVGCASKPSYFESPSESISANDRSLFSKALNEQGKGRYEAARKLWQAYIAEHPNSHEAHNNLGMAYFLDDRLSDSIPEFEAAHKWAPFSERIRDNLSRAYQLQVSVLEENREYDGAIGHLKSLSAISTAMEKEKVLFKIEELDHELFESLKKLNSPEGFENYIKKYPGGPNAREAKKRLEELQKSSSLPAEGDGVEAAEAPVEEGSAPTIADSHDEGAMGEVAELEDITDEVMSSEKPAMEEKSLPPMASGIDALPLTEDEPVEAVQSEVAEKMQETSEVMDSTMDGATTEAETLASQVETPTDNLISELSAVAEETNADVMSETNEVMDSQPTAATEELMSSGSESLSSKTIAEMEALADESSSEVSGMAENMMAESEVSTPVAEDSIVSATAVDTSIPEEAMEAAMSEASDAVSTSPSEEMVAKVDGPRVMGHVDSLPLAPTGEMSVPEREIPAIVNEPVPTVTEEETEAMMAEVEAEAAMSDVASEMAPVKIIVKVNSLLKVRSTPSLNGKVVGSLKNNDVRVMVKEVEGWYKVEHMDGRTGWISQKYSHKINGG